MVFSLEYLHFEVCDGIVHFIVYDIEQRGDFGKCLGHVLQQIPEKRHFLLTLHTAHEDNHQFSGRRGTDDEVAQHAFVRAYIIKGITMRIGIIANGVANAI